MAKNRVARRARPVEFISHHPTLIEGMKFSSQEFYARLEQALAAREIPNASVSRVDWKEGGALSSGREYLRIQRERFVFDVCAAPFGSGFFVSIWCAERPLRIGLLMWTLLVSGLGALWVWMDNLHFDRGGDAGVFLGIIALAVLAGIVIVGANLDLFMIGVPVIGFIYEKYFRTITYYRFDMMCMYQAAVRAAVAEITNEITKAQGISPLSEFEQKPIMQELR